MNAAFYSIGSEASLEALIYSNTASVVLSLQPHFINCRITYEQDFNPTFRFILRFLHTNGQRSSPNFEKNLQYFKTLKLLIIYKVEKSCNCTSFLYSYSLCSQVLIKCFLCSFTNRVSKYILIAPYDLNCCFYCNSKLTLYLGLSQTGEEVGFWLFGATFNSMEITFIVGKKRTTFKQLM